MIGALSNNGVGVAGVSWNSFLLPVREGNLISLHVLEAAGADLVLEKTMDGGNLGTLRADLGRATRVADDIGAVIEQALDEAALTTASHMLRLAEKAFELTLAYLRTRQQFGRIINLSSIVGLRGRGVSARLVPCCPSLPSTCSAPSSSPGCTPSAPPPRRLPRPFWPDC